MCVQRAGYFLGERRYTDTTSLRLRTCTSIGSPACAHQVTKSPPTATLSQQKAGTQVGNGPRAMECLGVCTQHSRGVCVAALRGSVRLYVCCSRDVHTETSGI